MWLPALQPCLSFSSTSRSPLLLLRWFWRRNSVQSRVVAKSFISEFNGRYHPQFSLGFMCLFECLRPFLALAASRLVWKCLLWILSLRSCSPDPRTLKNQSSLFEGRSRLRILGLLAEIAISYILSIARFWRSQEFKDRCKELQRWPQSWRTNYRFGHAEIANQSVVNGINSLNFIITNSTLQSRLSHHLTAK